MRANSIAGEVVRFYVLPGRKRKFGGFIEPGYDYNFAQGHERSFGVSGGLLIAIPARDNATAAAARPLIHSERGA